MLVELSKRCIFHCRRKFCPTVSTSNLLKYAKRPSRKTVLPFSSSCDYKILYFYFFYASSILMNLILLGEGLESSLSDNFPNIIISAFGFGVFLYLHFNSDSLMFKRKLQQMVTFSIIVDTLFFTHTRFLIEINQDPERIYFKTSLFVLNLSIASMFLRPMVTLYLSIATTGYVLLNIWIYRGYELYTALYGIASFFMEVTVFLFGIIWKERDKRGLKRVLNGKSGEKRRNKTDKGAKIIEIKKNINGDSGVKKPTIKDSLLYLDIIENIMEGVVIIDCEFSVKFISKSMENFIRKFKNSKELDPIKILSESAYFDKRKGKLEGKKSFAECLKLCVKDKTTFKALYHEIDEFEVHGFPIQVKGQACVLMVVEQVNEEKESKESQPNDMQLGNQVNNQVMELKSEIQTLQRKLDLLKKLISEFLEKQIKGFLNFCFPLAEIVIQNSQSETQRITGEILLFLARNLTVNFDNAMDMLAMKTNEFKLNFKNLSPKQFFIDLTSEIQQISKIRAFDFQLIIDEKTPDFFQTDFSRLKNLVFSLFSQTLLFNCQSSVKIIVSPFQIDGHRILQIAINHSNSDLISDFEKLKNAQKNLHNGESFDFTGISPPLWPIMICDLLIKQLGIEPKNIGLKIDAGISESKLSFWVLDKSNKLNKSLPLLKCPNVQKISTFVKSYSGASEISFDLFKKQSVTAVDLLIESSKYPSRKQVVANNYKFFESFEQKSIKDLDCPCVDALFIEDDVFEVFVLESIFMEKRIRIKKSASIKEAVIFLKDELVKEKCPFCRGLRLILLNLRMVHETNSGVRREIAQNIREDLLMAGIGEKCCENDISEIVSDLGINEILYRPITRTRILNLWTKVTEIC